MNCNAYLQKDIRICFCPKLHVKQLSAITFNDIYSQVSLPTFKLWQHQDKYANPT